MRNRRQRYGAITALFIAAGLLLAGCAIPVPTVAADPVTEGPQPALDMPRLESASAAITAALTDGDAAGDASLLSTRVSGPALATRTYQYALAAATAGTETPTTVAPLTLDPQSVIMSNSDTWPKQVFVITTIPEGQNTPLLVGLQQDTPRSPYTMFAWVRLLPETTTPATNMPADGSAPVAGDAEGLLMTPETALAAYADVLTYNSESESADLFASDFFREAVAADDAEIAAGVSDAGAFSDQFSVGSYPAVSLATADGGAIVFGALESNQVYQLTEDGGAMTVSTPGIVALAGADGSIDVDPAVTATYYVTVALYVPPAADGAVVTVLGAERILASVDVVEG